MVKINFDEKTSIPVEIGPVKIEFNYDDDSLKELQGKYGQLIDLQEKYNQMSESEDIQLDVFKKDVETITDSFLGKGTFQKLYELRASSLYILKKVLFTVQAVMVEISKIDTE